MANVLNRTTRQYLQSVNTPDYPVQDWIIDPDLSAVAGFSYIYWIISGDAVTLMDATQRATVDADLLTAARDATTAALDQVENIDRAAILTILDEVNNLRSWISDFKSETAAATNLSNFQSRVAALPAMPARTVSQLRTAVRNKLGS